VIHKSEGETQFLSLGSSKEILSTTRSPKSAPFEGLSCARANVEDMKLDETVLSGCRSKSGGLKSGNVELDW
jgi:hypothetical protein